jgi:hypothetical protein
MFSFVFAAGWESKRRWELLLDGRSSSAEVLVLFALAQMER